MVIKMSQEVYKYIETALEKKKTLFQAEVIKQMLLSNSIDAISMNQKDSSYHFGSVNIYTKEKDMKKAKEIISK